MIRTVLVTGANSGIGLATVLHLADIGFHVVGTARTEEKASTIRKAAAEGQADVEETVLDVRDAEGCKKVIEELEPWAVVNNAAYMNLGMVADVGLEDALHQIEAMVIAPMRLATLALPAMRKRGDGRIVNVSSVVDRATGGMMGWYQACKQALSAVTDALRIEVGADGIDVVLIEPGGFRTPIWDKGEDDLLRRRTGSIAPKAYDRALAILRAVRPYMSEPQPVAAAVGTALTAGQPRPRYRVGGDAAVVEALELLLPDRLKDRAIRKALGL